MLTIRNEYDTQVTKTFRIPAEINQMLTTLAENHNTSVNKVVIQCLEYALKNVDEDLSLQSDEEA